MCLEPQCRAASQIVGQFTPHLVDLHKQRCFLRALFKQPLLVTLLNFKEPLIIRTCAHGEKYGWLARLSDDMSTAANNGRLARHQRH